MQEDYSDWAPRKLSFRQAEDEQLAYALSLTESERLAASTRLTRELYWMRGIDLDDFKADLTPRRIARGKGLNAG